AFLSTLRLVYLPDALGGVVILVDSLSSLLGIDDGVIGGN
ncbi:13165_t:CDS:2, partial [Gigaspora rosea]